MPKTKIVCTIGPASQSVEMLKELMHAGMNVARFNFSHGDHQEHQKKYENVVQAREELGLPIATLLDTKGPEIRIKDFVNHKVELKKGQLFRLYITEYQGDENGVSITYPQLINDIEVGGNILIDDGLISLEIKEINNEYIACIVLNDGELSDKKGVNVPNAELSMPFLSDKDKEDILFGCELGFDYIALSFTRNKEDVLEVKELLKQHQYEAKIIAKIENLQGVNNIDEILEASDGILIARGDMGVEVSMQDVPVIQKEIIKRCRKQGKISITATQMLESMIKNPRPTRAEVADVANAIYDGTGAIMLSGESAKGLYPIEAVKTMVTIAERIESEVDYRSRRLQLIRNETGLINTSAAVSHAAVTLAEDIQAQAIVVATKSGFTAEKLARYQPLCPIVCYSVDPKVVRQLNLIFGINPYLIKDTQTIDDLLQEATAKTLSLNYVEKGEKLVFIAGVPLGEAGHTNMLKVVEV